MTAVLLAALVLALAGACAWLGWRGQRARRQALRARAEMCRARKAERSAVRQAVVLHGRLAQAIDQIKQDADLIERYRQQVAVLAHELAEHRGLLNPAPYRSHAPTVPVVPAPTPLPQPSAEVAAHLVERFCAEFYRRNSR